MLRAINTSRYGGVPVDFEIVQIHPTSDSNEDLEYAITSIRRNGVAIKGRTFISLFVRYSRI